MLEHTGYNDTTGFLVINKPTEITSFDCIRKIKKLFVNTNTKSKIKIGHTGTLDDFAQGLLIICIGRQATRYVRDLMRIKKEYIVKAKLGELTDSLDLTGNIVQSSEHTPNLKITANDIKKAITELGSSYEQTPPVYSALKHKGKPLYDLVRNQKLAQEKLEKIIKTKKRTVFLYEFELLEFDAPYFTFRALVSKGTYVRSLANDIAKKLGTHATTYELTRSKIGNIWFDDAVDINNIKTLTDIKNNLWDLKKIQEKLGISENFGCGGWI